MTGALVVLLILVTVASFAVLALDNKRYVWVVEGAALVVLAALSWEVLRILA